MSAEQRREVTDGQRFLRRDGQTSPILMGQERVAGGQSGVKSCRGSRISVHALTGVDLSRS